MTAAGRRDRAGRADMGGGGGGRCDASTSTEDVKGRPLCLFYFTHPFGVLSPEPPTVTAAPPHIARTYIDMEPVPYWSDSSHEYDTTTTRPSYELGNVTIHRNPIKLVRNYGLDFRRESMSSTLFSSEWFTSSSSSRSYDPRRLPPYTRTLPPLHLPVSRDVFGDSSEDMWPSKWVNCERFSLPPIEMPSNVSTVSDCEPVRKTRIFGVNKYKRTRRSGLRKMVTSLMRRNVKGRHRQASPALREALHLLREAWTEPRAFTERWPAGESSESCEQSSGPAMWSGDVPARASPGLLRRRYSVPETIMRKCRLEQQRSDVEEVDPSSATPASSPARTTCVWCGLRAGARRDRDPMRKSALLRFWGRAGTSPARNCPCAPSGTRSLDGSHSELRSAHRYLGPKRHVSSNHQSDGTYDSHTRVPSSNFLAPVMFSDDTKGSPRSLDTKIHDENSPVASIYVPLTDRSFTDSSETYTTSVPTTKEVAGASVKNQVSMVDYIDGRISERSGSAENEDSNVLPYDQPFVLETPSYDVLQIVVSETIDSHIPLPIKNGSPEKLSVVNSKNLAVTNVNRTQNIDIDEYVSNILVESLNSLTDQLESMNASICSDRKLSIVEKEIKVKLQNTGVNTIVHLSPTSNNQIIFGNEELYDSDRCNNRYDTRSSNIREELFVETNNNFTSAESLRDGGSSDRPITDPFVNATPENVNKAVLQQIQKLFQEDLTNVEPEMNSPIGPLPGISHIEISNVDVFIDNNSGPFTNIDTIGVKTEDNSNGLEVIGGIGTGNYYPDIENEAVVPRFSAFPHTESMEVNTSSSEDTEILGSDCASLVDSLDDPNSPRSILLRRSFSNQKRSELVRSAIDVLDLLPENINNVDHSPKEKSESFFVRIKDDECDCEKENVVVADHMPEQIKQRLYRRHRKRELRMECARRSRIKQMRKEINTSRLEATKSKNEIEKDCMDIISALIDEVISKIAQDEYKCMRIKQRSNKMAVTKSDDNLYKRKNRRDNDNNNRERRNSVKNGFSKSCSIGLDKQHRKTDKLVRNKLSIPTASPISSDDKPKRIYQKSEFHDGNKRIEILEILEYVNSSRSSSETNHSDENHNLGSKNKKSRIPVPVSEKVQKVSRSLYQNDRNDILGSRSTPPVLSRERNGASSQSVSIVDTDSEEQYETPTRRASVPCESRSRSNSLRFRNVFDIIPEERSLSLESTGDDSYNRRASAPSLNALKDKKEEIKIPQRSKEIRYLDTKSTGTSPMPDVYRNVAHNSVAAMTSPIRKSAATSPIRVASADRDKPQVLARRAQRRDEGSDRRKNIQTGDSGRRTDRSDMSDADTIPAIFRLKREKEKNNYDSISVAPAKRDSTTETVRGLDHHQQNNSNHKHPHDLGKGDREKNMCGKERRREKKEYEKERQLREEETSSSSESSGSLLCSLAPAWLNARRRRRRASNAAAGEWAVTVAGSCPAALPNDVEMRLRFPDPHRARAAQTSRQHGHAHSQPHVHSHTRAVEGVAECLVRGGTSGAGRARRRVSDDGRLTLTVKKEASDSSILASKSVNKSTELLPNLETYRASRSKTRSSVKTRGCSLHCWLPEGEIPQIRSRDELSVLGSSIVPGRKPRAPTMTERDLTRLHRARLGRPHYRC